ncbi:flagellar protein FlaG [compost metagenome]
MESIIPKNSGGIAPFPANTLNMKEQPRSSEQVQILPVTQQETIVRPQKTQEQAVEDLQKVIDAIQGPKRMLEVSVHHGTNAVMIKVLNEQSGEIIREIPSEKILDVAARMMEIAGMIVDTKI